MKIMNTEVFKMKKINLEVFLYYFATIAAPNIFLFNVYNVNREYALISFSHVLVLALILSAISILGLLVGRLLTRSYGTSLVVTLLGWLSFWFFEAGFRRLPINSRPILLILIFIGMLMLAIFFRVMDNKFKKVEMGFMALAGIIGLLFVFNAVPTFITVITSPSSQANFGVDGIPIRREFNVDSLLPSPSIYWFHVDALINPNSMERFFDISQAEIRNRLWDLGFVINEDAEFIAHNTVFGTPGLLSPDFYDYYLHDLFMQGRYLFRGGRQELLFSAFDADGISLANDVAPYHEAFHAFLAAGYRTVQISEFHPDVFTPIDYFYRIFDWHGYRNNTVINRENILTIGDGAANNHFLLNARELIELLSLMTPIPARFAMQVMEGDWEWETIPSHNEHIDRLIANTLNIDDERQLYRALLDSIERTEGLSTFTYIVNMFAHPWSWGLTNDGERAPGNYSLYHNAADYAMIVTFNMIDVILENNPNAIIVLQADHGLHFARTQRALLASGWSDEEVRHLHNSVFNAVRIPEMYGGLEAPLDSRNISRELINRFVGQNYELRTDTR